MTANQFCIMCQKMGIDPAIALECQAVVDALIERRPVAVWAALVNNF